MNDITQLLKEPSFWFGSVVVALFINIISAYCKGPLDRFFGKWSKAWREHSEQRNNAFMQKTWELAKDEEAMRFEWQREVRHRLKALTQILFSVALFIAAMSFLPAEAAVASWHWRLWASTGSIAGIIFMISLGNYFAAGGITALLEVARDLRVREILPEIERQRQQEEARQHG